MNNREIYHRHYNNSENNPENEYRGQREQDQDHVGDFIHVAAIGVGACISIITIIAKAVADSKRR